MSSQFLNLPVELQNIILKYRATQILKNICKDYYLDFNKLCEFLKMYNGIITGSCGLACFLPGAVFQDIDIFILRQETKEKPYHHFLPVFTLKNTDVIKIDKSPIDDPFLNSEPKLDSFDYKYQYKYYGLTIDMNVYPKGTYTHMRQLRETHYDLDCCKIMFDGNEWILPYTNILPFIQSRECRITLSGKDVFSEIYDPFNIESEDCNREYQDKMDAYTRYIIEKIVKNYYNLKLTAILRKPISGKQEQIWFSILNVFLDEKIIKNYPLIYGIINGVVNELKKVVVNSSREDLIEILVKRNNTTTQSFPGIQSTTSIYARIVLSKFLFRIIKYTLKGLHITNLSLLARGFPQDIVDQLTARDNKTIRCDPIGENI